MASVTRRFLYKGPWPLNLKQELDPALTLSNPQFAITYDITYDDMIPGLADVDAVMRKYGCFPDTQDTIVLSPTPFIGIRSPDNSIWKLSVDDLGVLTVAKVSV